MVRTLITRVMTASVDLELERYTAAKKMSAVVIWFLKENEARFMANSQRRWRCKGLVPGLAPR